MSHPMRQALSRAQVVVRTGRVRRILPTYIEATGPDAQRGALCRIETTGADGTSSSVMAQVVSVLDGAVVLAPFEDSPATFAGARVEALGEADLIGVGDAYRGRVVDALGRPLDSLGALSPDAFSTLGGGEISPLARTSPTAPLKTGIRSIDGLLTLGVGQRIGVFAPSGVGKTSLVAQLANQTFADHCILCLIGERGREVEALWNGGLSDEAKARATIVAATSDQSAVMRARAVDYALTLADYWRGAGKHVLLIVDSITRYAMALREMGLAAGEPPTVRAYTPSVFAAIPKVVERCGALRSGGSISAVMTVLSETEDNDDPICEMMKSLQDGHIILSRSLAEQGHFPAIDVPRSISRLAGHVTENEHRKTAQAAASMLSLYEASRMMIEAGLYTAGTNSDLDQAIAVRPALIDFLRQTKDEHADFAGSIQALAQTMDVAP